MAYTIEESVQRAREIDGNVWVVKAQIHSGGRGKAGGIKVCRTHDEVRAAAEELLGKILVTRQTGAVGKVCTRVYVEAGTHISREMYLCFLIDRSSERIVMIGSGQGGMEIEELARTNPHAIKKIFIEPAVGLQDFQAASSASFFWERHSFPHGWGIGSANPLSFPLFLMSFRSNKAAV